MTAANIAHTFCLSLVLIYAAQNIASAQVSLPETVPPWTVSEIGFNPPPSWWIAENPTAEEFIFPTVQESDLTIQAGSLIPAWTGTATHPFSTLNPAAYAQIDKHDDPLYPEIRTLAVSLNRDPVEIFRFVRDEITTEFQLKAVKGARATLKIGSGGMADKAALLLSLLEAAGYDADYVNAEIKIPIASRYGFDFLSISGANPHGYLPVGTISDTAIANYAALATQNIGGSSILQNYLRYMTWPHEEITSATDHVKVKRLWVRLTLNKGLTTEKKVDLDPSYTTRFFVQSAQSPDWASIMGYSKADLIGGVDHLTNAPGMAIESLNVSQLNAKMRLYGARLVSYFTQGAGTSTQMQELLSRVVEHNPPILSQADLIHYGAPWKIAWIGKSGSQFVSTSNVEIHPYGRFPKTQVIQMELRVGKRDSITDPNPILQNFCEPLVMAALNGRALALELKNTTANNDATSEGTLVADDTAIISNVTMGTPTSNRLEFRLVGFPDYLDMADPPNSGVANSDPYGGVQVTPKTKHVFSYLNCVSRAFLDEKARRLQNLTDIQGLTGTDWRVQAAMLDIIAQNWIWQTQLTDRLSVGLEESESQTPWRIGRASIAPKPLVDFFMQSMRSLTHGDGSKLEQRVAGTSAKGWLDSALEHMVIEDALGGDAIGASTAKVIQESLLQGGPVWATGAEMSLLTSTRTIPRHLVKTGPWKDLSGPLVNAISTVLDGLTIPLTKVVGGETVVHSDAILRLKASANESWHHHGYNYKTQYHTLDDSPVYPARNTFHLYNWAPLPPQPQPPITSSSFIAPSGPGEGVFPPWVQDQAGYDTYFLEHKNRLTYPDSELPVLGYNDADEVLTWSTLDPRYFTQPPEQTPFYEIAPQGNWYYYPRLWHQNRLGVVAEATRSLAYLGYGLKGQSGDYIMQLGQSSYLTIDPKGFSVVPGNPYGVYIGEHFVLAAALCSSTRINMLVGSNGFSFYGGLLTTTGTLDPWTLTLQSTSDPNFLAMINPTVGTSAYNEIMLEGLNFHSFDPIDMRTGAYLYDSVDMTLTTKPSMVFSRHYSSIEKLNNDAKVGLGWTHNHYIRLIERTDADVAFGAGRPEEAAAVIAAYFISRDLTLAARATAPAIKTAAQAHSTRLNNGEVITLEPTFLALTKERSFCAIVPASLACWVVEQTKGGSVVVVSGNKRLQFVRQVTEDPNAVVYLPPPGRQELSLVKTSTYADGVTTTTYQLNRRHSGFMSFAKVGTMYAIQKDQDADGNYLNYTYDTNFRLATVSAVPAGSAVASTQPKFTFTYSNAGMTIVTVANSATQPNQQTCAYTYSAGKLMTAKKRVNIGAGNTWTYRYDMNNRLDRLQDPEGRIIAENVYDAQDRVIEQYQLGKPGTNPAASAWTYLWLPRESRETTPMGHTTSFLYDSVGRLIRIIDPYNNWQSFTHDDQNNVIKEEAYTMANNTVSRLKAVDRFYRADGLIEKEIAYGTWNGKSTFDGTAITFVPFATPQQSETRYFYDDKQRLERVVTPNGLETEFIYYKGGANDERARLWKSTDPLNRTTELKDYDQYGNIGTLVHPGVGIETRRLYDSRGRVIKETAKDGKWTRFDWKFDPDFYAGPSGSMDQTGYGNWVTVAVNGTSGLRTVTTVYQAITEGAGILARSGSVALRSVTEEFDGVGNLVGQTTLPGGKWIYTYDGLGRRLVSQAPRDSTAVPFPTITESYDTRGWLKSVAKKLNATLDSVTQYTRTKTDRVDQVTNPLGYHTTTIYDALERAQTTQNSLNKAAHRSYLGGTNLVSSVTNELGYTSGQFYNTSGNKIALANKRGNQWLFAYDNAERLVATQSPSGKLYSNVWNDRDFITSTTEPSGQVTQFLEYDAAGRIIRKKDDVNVGTSETVFGYDNAGRLTSLQENGSTSTRSYTPTGDMSHYTNERGEEFTYTHQEDGQIATITYPSIPGWSTTGKTVTYTYDKQLRLKTVKDWKNRLTTYLYDTGGRLESITHHNGSNSRITYDNADRPIEIKDSWVSSGRLISLFRFSFDSANRMTKRFGIPYPYGKQANLSASYDADNRFTSLNGNASIYDADGNLLSANNPLDNNNITLAYDSRNRLISAHALGRNSSNTYDAEGIRQAITVDGITTTFYVSPVKSQSQVYGYRTSDDPNKVTWCIYGLGLLYEIVETRSSNAPVTYTESARVHHYDQVGNTVAITDDLKKDRLWVQYDAYGAIVEAKAPQQTDGSMGESSVNMLPVALDRAVKVTPFLFSGEYGVVTDATGLIHMRARFYHPGFRRFLNQDPIGFDGGMNWYGYTGGNPLTASDPSGLDWLNYTGVSVADSVGPLIPGSGSSHVLNVIAHGNNLGIQRIDATSNNWMTAADFVKYYRDMGWKYTEINFYSCNGANTGGISSGGYSVAPVGAGRVNFAAEVAKELKIQTSGATKFNFLQLDGSEIIASLVDSTVPLEQLTPNMADTGYRITYGSNGDQISVVAPISPFPKKPAPSPTLWEKWKGLFLGPGSSANGKILK